MKINAMTFLVRSIEDTETLARSLARELPTRILITLDGDLGAGKTTFVGALAQALGVSEDVSSPTFTIHQHYLGADVRLSHLDVYRLESAEAFRSIGLESVWEDEEIVLLEWSRMIAEILPESYLAIEINSLREKGSIDFSTSGPIVLEEDLTPRIFTFIAHGEEIDSILEAWRKARHFPHDLLLEGNADENLSI